MQGPDGPTLDVTAHGLPLQSGYYEVWVFDGSRNMVSVGVLGPRSTAALPLPPTLDLRTYHIVDISAECTTATRPTPRRASCAAPSPTDRRVRRPAVNAQWVLRTG